MTLAFDQCQRFHSFYLLNLYFFFFVFVISNLFILPFNILVKFATADVVLLNSVIVEAKFVVAVSKLFEVSEQFYSKRKFIEQLFLIVKTFKFNHFWTCLSDLFSHFLQRLLFHDLPAEYSLHNQRKQLYLKFRLKLIK
jgi:hypothetical protein